MLSDYFACSLPLTTGPDGMPHDPKGNPAIQRAISIEFALALDGRVFATLSANELKRFEFYRVHGLEFGIVATIVNTAEPAEMTEAQYPVRQNEGRGSVNSTVSVVRVTEKKEIEV